MWRCVLCSLPMETGSNETSLPSIVLSGRKLWSIKIVSSTIRTVLTSIKILFLVTYNILKKMLIYA